MVHTCSLICFLEYIKMLKLFTRYISVGIINTIIHWAVFLFFFYIANADQAISNFGAFCIAVTFSFFANAHYTFNAKVTTVRYIIYVVFMGVMSIVVGVIADHMNFPPISTLILFSVFSLICGFLYSKFIVFRSEIQ